MIVTHHRQKLINAIIYFVKKTKYCGKTKLLKLLYFLDFWHFKETGKSVTGLNYAAWEFGPVPVDLYNELTKKMSPDLKRVVSVDLQGDFHQIKPLKNFDLKYMTKREKRLLNEIVEIFKDTKAEQMIESTHLPQSPWDTTIKQTGMKGHINYLLALDNNSNSLQYDEVIHRQNERQEMYREFGIEK
jgi:uncharacterized phage-associated protein